MLDAQAGATILPIFIRMRSFTLSFALIASAFTIAITAPVASAVVDPNTIVVCPGGEIEPFRWGVLKGPRNAEKDKSASAWLLRKIIREKSLEFMPRSRWFVIAKGRQGRTDFIQYAQGNIDGLTAITFTRRDGKKRWTYSHSGHGFDCDPHLTTRAGRAATEWYPVAESLPTNPSARSIRIVVSENNCNGGQAATGRVFADSIEYSATEVKIRIDIRPNEGPATCPSNPPTYYDVPLTEQIGERSIVDTSRAAPRTRASAAQLAAVRSGANPVEQLLFNKTDAEFCKDPTPYLLGGKVTREQERRWYKRAADSCPKRTNGI